MGYRVYCQMPGETRFKAVGSYDGGVCQVASLFYAYYWPEDCKEAAKEFLKYAKKQAPDCKWELRHVK